MQFFKIKKSKCYLLSLILFMVVYSMPGNTSTEYKLSDHYNGKIFFNPGDDAGPNSFVEVIKWKLTGKADKWPKKVIPSFPQAIPKAVMLEKMSITFVGHVSFLIQMDGLNILTDPVWSDRASPFSFAGPIRTQPPGIAFENLPKIDIVLISHNHYDHMDAETITLLEKKFSPHFIVPLANIEKMKTFGATTVTELDWWDSININPQFKITLTPARHWSSRTPWDKRAALWGSFFIEGIKEKIYFAGDTAYGPHFAEIYKRLGAPTLSLIPIGAYEPRWFMKGSHMNPEEAVLSHLDLQSKISLGMHFGTFQLTDEAIDAPLKDLQMAKERLKVENFKVLDPGQSLEQ
jgi:L-ascorbate metabolism protein UlaG (beta-lactamase superfamily)